MIRTAQKVFNLNETQRLWVRPGEDLKATIAFVDSSGSVIDMTAATFVFQYEEAQWSYAPKSYTTITSGTLAGVFDVTDAVNGNIVVNIDDDVLAAWNDRKIKFQVVVDDAWVAVDGLISVLEGE